MYFKREIFLPTLAKKNIPFIEIGRKGDTSPEDLQPDQINMALCFWYLVKSN